MSPKKLIILLNIGSPDSPGTSDVRRYLVDFLDNKRIINLPWLLRKILVKGIISSLRATSSSRKYKEIWTKDGSPLIVNAEKCTKKLQKSLDDEYIVENAMINGSPNLYNVMKDNSTQDISELIFLPMYPHYATSTTLDAIEKFEKFKKKFFPKTEAKIINPFYSNKHYITALANKFKDYYLYEYDHIIFSYHGLPTKQVESAHINNENCTELDCTNNINEKNSNCYLAQCYKTTHLLAKKLGLVNISFSTSFQSRFSNNWISPHTNELLIKLAKSGRTKVLIICPSFVSDCLETLHEIKIEYNELFLKNGGEKLEYVDCLNDNDDWIFALKRMVT